MDIDLSYIGKDLGPSEWLDRYSEHRAHGSNLEIMLRWMVEQHPVIAVLFFLFNVFALSLFLWVPALWPVSAGALLGNIVGLGMWSL